VLWEVRDTIVRCMGVPDRVYVHKPDNNLQWGLIGGSPAPGLCVIAALYKKKK